jgi:hypothetical protein
VCDETTENPFPACVYYTMPGTLSFVNRNVGIGRVEQPKKKKKREELLKRRIFSFILPLKLLYL